MISVSHYETATGRAVRDCGNPASRENVDDRRILAAFQSGGIICGSQAQSQV